jgi:hypothetical protein
LRFIRNSIKSNTATKSSHPGEGWTPKLPPRLVPWYVPWWMKAAQTWTQRGLDLLLHKQSHEEQWGLDGLKASSTAITIIHRAYAQVVSQFKLVVQSILECEEMGTNFHKQQVHTTYKLPFFGTKKLWREWEIEGNFKDHLEQVPSKKIVHQRDSKGYTISDENQGKMQV